jgi:hypothetical protein
VPRVQLLWEVIQRTNLFSKQFFLQQSGSVAGRGRGLALPPPTVATPFADVNVISRTSGTSGASGGAVKVSPAVSAALEKV